MSSSREDTRECRQKANATKCSAHMTAICNQPVYIPQTKCVPLFIRYCPHRDELSHYSTLLSRTRVCKKPRHHGKLAHNMQSPGIYILYILYIRNIYIYNSRKSSFLDTVLGPCLIFFDCFCLERDIVSRRITFFFPVFISYC